MTSTSSQMAAKTVEATERYHEIDSKTETIYYVWKNTDRAIFDEMKESKELSRQFAGYMKAITSGKATSIQHLVNGYDWVSLGETTVVDLGGSNGHASIALANAFPHLSFDIQDLWDTIESSRPDLTLLPPAVSSSLTFQHHNFFTPQPLHDVDVFLLRMIVHDWPNPGAQSIIRNLINSMKPGGKLIIMNTALPRPGRIPVSTEAALRVRDLTMLQVHNSKKREIEEWEELLRAADPRLRIHAVRQPFGSSMSVLEVVRDDHVQSNGLEAVNGNAQSSGLEESTVLDGGINHGVNGHTQGAIGGKERVNGTVDEDVNVEALPAIAVLPGANAT